MDDVLLDSNLNNPYDEHIADATALETYSPAQGFSASMPDSMKCELAEQFLAAVAVNTELLLSPPSILSLRIKKGQTQLLVFPGMEQLVDFCDGQLIEFKRNRGNDLEVMDLDITQDSDNIVCMTQKKALLLLLECIQCKLRCFNSPNVIESYWNNLNAPMNQDEVLEFINRYIDFQRKLVEHSNRGEEIFPDDLNSLLNNPYAAYDPYDYTSPFFDPLSVDMLSESPVSGHSPLIYVP